MSLAYDEYLNEHIGAVQKGWNWMLDNLIERIHPWIREQYPNSEFDPIDVFEIGDQMQDHDASKIRPEEYYPYDAYFYGGNKSHAVVENFQKAFLLHMHENPHHWRYWVLIHGDPDEPETLIEIPLNYIFEMICDWWSFSWRKGDLMEIFNWWDEHKNYIRMHKKSRKVLEYILKEMKDILMEGKAEEDPEEISHSDEYNTSFEDFGVGDENRFKNYIPEKHLAHHGIQGQEWGKRNGPPYPLNSANKNDLTKAYTKENLKNADKRNLDSWGKSADTNCLYISGTSGSGKSTVALGLADNGDTVIHLDGYTEPDIYEGMESIQNKKFNKYLDSHVDNWKDIYMDKDKTKAQSKDYWKKVDEFRAAIEDYSKNEFANGHKVIVEGVQVTNGWLSEGQSYHKDKPFIYLTIDEETARRRAQERDADQ